jgi:hypothetical protein
VSKVIAFASDWSQLDFRKNLLKFQVGQIGTLIGTAIVVGIIEWVWPNFFNYPYVGWKVNILDMFRFWPLFLYCGIMSVLVSSDSRSTSLDEKLAVYGIGTSILAGLWEEIGFRYLYICTGMVIVMASNWIISSVFGIILLVVSVVGAIAFISERRFVFGIGSFAIAGFLALLCFRSDPTYWLYNTVIIPVISFVSFGSLDTILHNGHEPLFVMGAIAANARFRDGHKYQGLFGFMNSWVVGFVLLYAALTYGLLVAIAIHVAYDILISVVQYSFRKING